MLLHARDVLGRIVVVERRRFRQAAHAGLARPARVGHDRHAAHAERRQHATDVADEALRRHHEQRVARAEPPRIFEVQERDAVERDRGLAGAGATLDHHDAGARLRDEVELFLIDQRRDLGKALVRAHLRAVVDAELALLAGRRDWPRGLAHAAVEHRGHLADGLEPRALRIAQVRALRCADAAEVALRDRDVAANLDEPLDGAAGDLVLVVVAFLVAVVDARDRRVAPVDDLDVRLAVDEAALANHHVLGLAALFQLHVREVRRRDVDRQRAAAADSRAERREPCHLLHQRREVLGARFGDLVAQRQQILVEVARADPVFIRFFAQRDPGLDLAVEAFLFRDDRRGVAAFFDFLAHKWSANLVTSRVTRKCLDPRRER